jgi:hypothetical protein
MPEPICICNLNAFSRNERAHYTDLTKQLRSAVIETRERDNGFEFRIMDERLSPSEIVEWILLERKCCPFIVFDLRFEAEQGPVWLALSGGVGVKDFIRGEFT